MTLSAPLKIAIERAVDHLRCSPDTDIFPCTLDGVKFFKDRDAAIVAVTHLHNNFDEIAVSNPPELIRSLIPTGYSSYRLGTQIPHLWNAYYLSLVISCAEEIEHTRASSKIVFSYRFDTKPDH